MWGDNDYYEVLGVSPDATDEEIKSAYRALARRFHPDTAEEDHLTQMFRDVHEAYVTLSTPAQRAAYDRWRKEKGFASPSDDRIQLSITPSANQMLALDEPQMLYVILDIAVASGQTAGRLPFNLCLVIDHSTSMKGARLQKVKESTREIIDHLREQDVFALVAFNDRAQVVIPSQSNINKISAKSLLNNIQAGGGTEIYHGLAEGLRQVRRRFSPRYVNHIILLTDGQTYGDEQACLNLAQDALAAKVGVSTVGIGADWNDELLDRIAAISGGSSHYLAQPEEINRFFQTKIESLADVLAQKAELTVRIPDGVTLCGVFRISPILQQLSPFGEKYELGALGVRGGQSILLELLLPPAKQTGKYRAAHFTVTAEIASKSSSTTRNVERELFVSFADTLSEPVTMPERFLPTLNSVNIYRLQQKAMLDIEQGQIEKATHRLEVLATRLLDMGEVELARAALLEAGSLAKTGVLSPEGQKKLKYGTRSLSLNKSGTDTCEV